MDTCDIFDCENMARIEVTGPRVIGIQHLCAKHCADLCLYVGDGAGFDKFTALSKTDTVEITQ